LEFETTAAPSFQEIERLILLIKKGQKGKSPARVKSNIKIESHEIIYRSEGGRCCGDGIRGSNCWRDWDKSTARAKPADRMGMAS
jgi:hypothetical protein